MEIVHVTVEPPTDDFGPERLEGEVLSIEDERDRRERAKTPWRALGSFVDEIEQHKNDPWIALRLVDDEIARLRVGAMAVLVGGPGSGKSTLAANLLYQHAADVGPSIMQSIELPGIEFTARTIGIKCDESWIGVLTGRVPVSEMRRVTALERFVVLERDLATLGNLRITIDAMAKAFPKQPILIAVDYVQILENERERRGDREERLRVSDIVKALDAIARQYGVVVIALSQMSTSNAKAARAGDALGADAGELAASGRTSTARSRRRASRARDPPQHARGRGDRHRQDGHVRRARAHRGLARRPGADPRAPRRAHPPGAPQVRSGRPLARRREGQAAREHAREGRARVGAVAARQAARALGARTSRSSSSTSAHHAAAKGYRAILEHFDGAKVVGVTATPDRADGKELGETSRASRTATTSAGDRRRVPRADRRAAHRRRQRRPRRSRCAPATSRRTSSPR
jgi:hypothetical protein